MASSIKTWISEILMCASKQVPIVGQAIEVVDNVQKRHELLGVHERVTAIEKNLTRFDRKMRDLVQGEIRTTIEGLSRRDLDGPTFSSHIKNLVDIKSQGWSTSLFQGLLEQSVHWDQLNANPSFYGSILDDRQAIDPKKLQVFLDTGKIRILELTPIALHALLSRQHEKSPSAKIVSHADIWALSNRCQPSVSSAEGLTLKCTACGQILSLPGGKGSASGSGKVKCPLCGNIFSIKDGFGPPTAVTRTVLHQNITNSIGMRLNWIAPGKFKMGSAISEAGRGQNENQHQVAITRGFYMGIYPVTQGQYRKVLGDTPSYFSSDGDGRTRVTRLDTNDFPVESVSWDDAKEFCAALTDMEKHLGRIYGLPTEAEWEYSCRAGKRAAFCFGNTLSLNQANFDGTNLYGAPSGECLSRTTQVGSYGPNAWGLYGMHGNVWEWCEDWYDEDYYHKSPEQDPKGPPSGRNRILRGGSWHSNVSTCRAAYRYADIPENNLYIYGFRVIMR